MDVSDQIKARIASALERIRKAADSAAETAAREPDQLASMRRENESLKNQLSELQHQREMDIKELDGLVAQLKPLIGEN